MKIVITICAYTLLSTVACASNSTLVKTTLKPSKELLNIVGVSDYEITEFIVMNLGSGESKSTPTKVGYCENANALMLKAMSNSKLENVKFINAAIETNTHEKPKLLFTIKNEGGFSISSYIAVRLDIHKYNPGEPNIWVFFHTKDKVYANAAKIKCNIIVH